MVKLNFGLTQDEFVNINIHNFIFLSLQKIAFFSFDNIFNDKKC